MNGPDSRPHEIKWQARLSSKRSADFTELFPAQEAALATYATKFLNEPSVAIELPTGSGKTLIASLILDYWMEKQQRTAVLCGTKNLARQFKVEADSLHVPATLFEGKKASWTASDKMR
jgi:superfamily II DNA or RNA helicase